MEIICYKCGKIRLHPECPKYLKLSLIKDSKQKFKYAWDTCKSKKVCEFEECGAQLFPIRKQNGYQLFLLDIQKPKNNQKIILSPSDVRNAFKKISDFDCNLIGLKSEISRPEWMILTCLPVPPGAVRPSVSMDTQSVGQDDLTHKLADIIKENN